MILTPPEQVSAHAHGTPVRLVPVIGAVAHMVFMETFREQHFHWLTDHIPGRVAEEIFDLRIAIYNLSIFIGDQYGIWHGFEDQACGCFTFAQEFVGCFQLGGAVLNAFFELRFNRRNSASASLRRVISEYTETADCGLPSASSKGETLTLAQRIEPSRWISRFSNWNGIPSAIRRLYNSRFLPTSSGWVSSHMLLPLSSALWYPTISQNAWFTKMRLPSASLRTIPTVV